MKGCRPLTDDEVTLVADKLLSQSRNGQRNQLLFLLGCRTGFRISELLSLKVGDVVQHGKAVTRVTVTRAAMKGKIESRSVALVNSLKPLILAYVKEAGLSADEQLFGISRSEAHRILTKAFDVLRMDGKLATHSCRKTFANKVYAALDHDLVKTQAALGHKWVSTTAQYISFAQEDVDAAVLAAG